MLAQLKKLVKDCLTGKDGETYDPARVYGALAVLTFLGLAIYSVIRGQHWEAQGFGAGFGLLLAGFGIGVGVKSHTEPEQ